MNKNNPDRARKTSDPVKGTWLRLSLALALAIDPALPGVGVISASAQTPPALINFQGRLVDNLNNPLAGPHSFFLEIYDAAAGGNQLWSETQGAVTVVNGIMSTSLGLVAPLPPAVFSGSSLWVQITVDGALLSPRQRLVSVAYALNSSLLSGLSYQAFVSTNAAAQSIAGNKTFTGAPVFASSTTWLGMAAPPLSAAGSGAIYFDGAQFQVSQNGGGYTPLLPADVDNFVLKTGDTMTGQLTNTSTVTVQGNAFSVGGSTLVVAGGLVGIGTTNPLAPLHVAGQCVTADTLIPTLRGLGQIREIPIVELKSGDRVLSLNEAAGRIEPHRVKGLLDMGVRPVFRLTTASGRSIRTTGNHPYLTRKGWRRVVELKVGEEVAVPDDPSLSGAGHLPEIGQRDGKPADGADFPTRHHIQLPQNGRPVIPLSTFPANADGNVPDQDETILPMMVHLDLPLLDRAAAVLARIVFVHHEFTAYTVMTRSIPEPSMRITSLASRLSSTVFEKTLDLVMAAHVKPLDAIALPTEEYAISEAGPDLPVRPTQKSQAQAWRGRLTLGQATGQGLDGFFDFGLSGLREGLEQAYESGFGLKAHAYAPSINFLKLWKERKVGPFWRLMRESRPTSLLRGAAPREDARTLARGKALSMSASYSSRGTKTIGRFKRQTSWELISRVIPNSPRPSVPGRFGAVKAGGPACGPANAVLWDRVISIVPLAPEPVWDIEVEGTHNFIGNRIFAHNTYISGNLGIGTTSPATKLDVSGDVVARSSVTFAGALSSDPAAIAGQGALYYNTSANKMKVLQNGSWANLGTAGFGGGWTEVSPGGVIDLTNSADNVVIQSTLTVQGNAFSVGGSTLVVTGGGVAVGTTTVDPNLVNTRLNVFGTPGSNVVLEVTGNQADASGAVEGDVAFSAASNTSGTNGTRIANIRAYSSGATATNRGGDLGIATKLDGSGLVERLRITKDGNVGIGTTSPLYRLDVAGPTRVQASSSTWTSMAAPPVSAGTQGAIYFDGAQFQVSQNGNPYSPLTLGGAGNFVLKTGDTMTGQLTNTSTITVQGNAFSVGGSSFVVVGSSVGIRTTSPAEALEINGAMKMANVRLIQDTGDTGRLMFQPETSATSVNISVIPNAGGGSTGLEVYGTNNLADRVNYESLRLINNRGGPIPVNLIQSAAGGTGVLRDTVIQFNATETARFTAAGNVGIGTTSPATKLHMSSGTFTIDGNNAAPFSVNGSTFVITGGNVGVGTTGPIHNLDVNGAGVTGAGSLNGGYQFGVYRSGVGDFTIGSDATYAYLQSWQSKPLQINNQGNNVILNYGGGNVGIGTTSPSQKLSISGGEAVLQNASDSWYASSDTTHGNFFELIGNYPGWDYGAIYIGGYNATNGGIAQGNKVIVGGSGSTLPLIVTGAMTVQGSGNSSFVGNVGIGTTGPATLLDVNGAAQFGSGVVKSTFSATTGGLTFASAFTPALAQDAATKNYVDTKLLSGGGPWTQAGSVVDLTTPGNNAVVQSTLTVQGNAFSVGGSTLVVTQGNVGIGTTSPNYMLHLSSSATSSEAQLAHFQNSGGGTAVATVKIGEGVPEGQYGVLGHYGVDNSFRIGNLGPSGNNGYLSFHVGLNTSGANGTTLNSTNEFMRITNSGNVGIGTTGPQALLDVDGTASNATYLRLGKTSGASSVFGDWVGLDFLHVNEVTPTPQFTGNPAARISAYLQRGNNGYGLQFWTRNDAVTFNEAMRITAEGNVGIGTTIPGTKLEVVNAPTFSILTLSTAATSGNGSHIMDFGMFDTKATITSERSGLPLRFKARGGDAPDLVVATSGNVGIGTTGPLYPLHVVGTGFFSSAVRTPILSTNGASNQLLLDVDSGVSPALLIKNRATTTGDLLGVQNEAGAQLVTVSHAGNVGIGTTGPAYPLDVNGAVRATQFISNQAPGAQTTIPEIAVSTIDATATTPYGGVNVTTNVFVKGNVGIGTTAPGGSLEVASSNNQVVISRPGQVGKSRASADGAEQLNLTVNASYNGTTWNRDNTATSARWLKLEETGNLTYSTAAAGANPITWSTPFVVTSAGNVGIGTTGPQGYGSGATGPFVNIYNSGTGSASLPELYLGNAATAVGQVVGTLGFNAGASGAEKRVALVVGGTDAAQTTVPYGNLQFLTANGSAPAEKMRITSTGNVGIGTTGPTTNLDVRGTAAAGVLTVDQANTAGNKFARFTYSGVTGNYGSIGIQPNAIEYVIGPAVTNMAITGGNVGIGTTSPGGKLEVNGTLIADSTQYMQNGGIALGGTTGNTFRSALWLAGASDCNHAIYSDFNTPCGYTSPTGSNDSEYIDYYSGLVFQPRISGSPSYFTNAGNLIIQGNVGIGTTSPGNKLAVSGSVAGSVGAFIDNTNTAGYGVLRVNSGNADVGVGAALHHFGTTWASGGGARMPDQTDLASWGSNGIAVSAENAAGIIKFLTAGAADANERMRITSAGNVGIGTTAPSRALDVVGGMKSTLWNVTQLFNATPGSLPLTSAAFTAHGGTLLVWVSGTGYAGAAQQIGLQVKLDSTANPIQGYAKSFTNEVSSHKAFSANPLVITGVAAGSHTVLLEAWNSTSTDINDFFNVTVMELPF